MELFPLVLAGWAWLEVHLEGRGDGCQRLLNPFSADSIFASSVAASNPMGKSLDEGELFWKGKSCEVWVWDATVVVKARYENFEISASAREIT